MLPGEPTDVPWVDDASLCEQFVVYMDMVDWLEAREERYGGIHRNVKRNVVSPHDPRTSAEIARGGMIGGDRMGHDAHAYAVPYSLEIVKFLGDEMPNHLTPELLAELERKYSGGNITTGIATPTTSPNDPRPHHEIARGMFDGHRMQPRESSEKAHNYAPAYAKELGEFKSEPSTLESRSRLTIVELGILRGIGLAIWCDLFPNARVIGLDVDLSHYLGNVRALEERGAFKNNKPDVFEFDELASPDANQRQIAFALGRSRIDIMIDDALHRESCIMKAMQEFMPFMAPRFLYFVEDNFRVHVPIKRAFPKLAVRTYEELTVVSHA